jgi:hypothetical protein
VRPATSRWSRFVFVLALLAVAVAGIFYTNHVQRESERKWCEILTILTTGPQPETDRGRAVARAMAALRNDFGC